jgi:protein-tyrosine phosphatase
MIVCIGNICRSPMAEVLLQQKKPNLKVFSSGLGALVGHSADPMSVKLMRQKDINLDEHCAQQINSVLVSASDLILTMEKKHVDAIQAQFPESRGKVHLIGKWENNQEIPDPYKRGDDAFILALALIESGLDTWQKKL